MTDDDLDHNGNVDDELMMTLERSERVGERLTSVFDSEATIHVVDLGLIYSCDALQLKDGSLRVENKLSAAVRGFTMGDVLSDDARSGVRTDSDASAVDGDLASDRSWDLSRMSDAAQLELAMFKVFDRACYKQRRVVHHEGLD